MIESFEYKGKKAGLRLAITGSVHGNEVCGTKALRNIISKIEKGELALSAGSLLAIPVANPEAHKKCVRFVDDNLNRVFKHHDNPINYEQNLANELTALIKDCDALLDLHSIHTKGFPFAMHFGYFSDAEEEYINALGMKHIIHGWAEAYERSLPSKGDANSHTVGYMHSIGKIAAGVECGKHDDAAAVEVAEKAIMHAMAHFGLIDELYDKVNAQKVLMHKVFLRTDMQDVLAQNFVHGSSVKQGELIAVRKTGEEIKAEEDCLVLFPRPDCPVGEEFFYTGKFIA